MACRRGHHDVGADHVLAQRVERLGDDPSDPESSGEMDAGVGAGDAVIDEDGIDASLDELDAPRGEARGKILARTPAQIVKDDHPVVVRHERIS